MDNHPVLKEMQEIGCCDISQVDLAFQVYMELCEAKLMCDVSHRYIADLDLILLSGRRHRNTDVEIFVPVSASADMNLEWLELLQHTIGVPSEHGTKLTLAIVDSDSTVVLQELTQGLVPPKSDKRRRQKLDPATFLTAELEEAATSRSLVDQTVI